MDSYFLSLLLRILAIEALLMIRSSMSLALYCVFIWIFQKFTVAFICYCQLLMSCWIGFIKTLMALKMLCLSWSWVFTANGVMVVLMVVMMVVVVVLVAVVMSRAILALQRSAVQGSDPEGRSCTVMLSGGDVFLSTVILLRCSFFKTWKLSWTSCG